MRKSLLSLNGVVVLSNEEQKMVNGGLAATCGYSITISAGEGVSGTTTFTACGVSKAEATSAMSLGSGHWCCSSCGQTSYCGGLQ